MKALITKNKISGETHLHITSEEEVKYMTKTINMMGFEIINEYTIDKLYTQINFASKRDLGESAQGTYKG